MRISWGYKIAALYIGFVVMMIGLVAATFWQPSQLVTKDYYALETGFNQRMQQQQAASKLSVPLKIDLQQDDVLLQFPSEFKDKQIKGQAYFYSVADMSRDRRFPIEHLDNGDWRVSRANLPHGKYELQVEWTAEGTSYFQTKDLQLN